MPALRAILMSIRSLLPEPIGPAAYHLNPDIIIRDAVASGINVHENLGHGNTALHFVARYGWIDYINPLVDAGIDVNKPNDAGKTAIDIIAELNRWPEFEKLRTFTTLSNLFYMASKNILNSTVILMLKELEPLVNSPLTGKTVLHLYAAKKHTKAVRFVLKYGADPYLPDIHGFTVMHSHYRLVHKTRMSFPNYIKYNRFDRKISRFIEEDYDRIPSPKSLLLSLDQSGDRDGTYYYQAVEIINHFHMHRLGVVLIRVIPMLLLWRKRATERCFHPSRLSFDMVATFF